MESVVFFFFFFQAEDGIRDKLVTGVQTCALPISILREPAAHRGVVLELGDAGVVARGGNPEHQVLVSRLLDQVGEAASLTPPVDEDWYVAVREVRIAWEDATDLVAVEDIHEAATGRSLGGREPRNVAGAQLALDAVEVRLEADSFGSREGERWATVPHGRREHGDREGRKHESLAHRDLLGWRQTAAVCHRG